MGVFRNKLRFSHCLCSENWLHMHKISDRKKRRSSFRSYARIIEKKALTEYFIPGINETQQQQKSSRPNDIFCLKTFFCKIVVSFPSLLAMGEKKESTAISPSFASNLNALSTKKQWEINSGTVNLTLHVGKQCTLFRRQKSNA